MVSAVVRSLRHKDRRLGLGENNMKKRVIAVVAASAVTLCTAVTIAVGGTAGDPMLSKSYIDGA